MTRNNYFVLTGAMGAGKSTVLSILRKMKCVCIEEPARVILKEQRSTGGMGVPEVNAELFNKLMLSRMILQFESNSGNESVIIFDRGIADIVAYSYLLNTDAEESRAAAEKYRYNRHVFFFDGWKEIYSNDEERKMSYTDACNFGRSVKNVYNELGYAITDVPFIPAKDRAVFILTSIENELKNKD